MFDDQPLTGGRGQVPGNLPTAEPEDILSGTDKPETAGPATEPAPTSNSALSAGALRPKRQQSAPSSRPTPSAPRVPEAPAKPSGTPQSPSTESMPPAGTVPPSTDSAPPSSPPAGEEVYMVKEPVLSKGLMTIIITVVVLAIIGGGGWFIYATYIASEKSTETFTTEQSQQEDFFQTEPIDGTGIDVEQEQETDQEMEQRITDEEILFGDIVDSDNDNLGDERERELGTDPNTFDTDEDGIGDGEEVIVWKTDPLNPDTDGDGYLDGEEVEAGYNPLGSGSLFQPPQISTE